MRSPFLERVVQFADGATSRLLEVSCEVRNQFLKIQEAASLWQVFGFCVFGSCLEEK